MFFCRRLRKLKSSHLFTGYANEVGEAFRALVPVSFVWGSYAVATVYVTADAVDKGKKAAVVRFYNLHAKTLQEIYYLHKLLYWVKFSLLCNEEAAYIHFRKHQQSPIYQTTICIVFLLSVFGIWQLSFICINNQNASC